MKKLFVLLFCIFFTVTLHAQRGNREGQVMVFKKPLAGGSVFQMDKATLKSKIFLGYHDECSQNAGILRHHYILHGYHC